jgi:hypothetical protein
MRGKKALKLSFFFSFLQCWVLRVSFPFMLDTEVCVLKNQVSSFSISSGLEVLWGT